MSLGLDPGGDLTPTRTGDPGTVSKAHPRQTPKTHPKRRGGSLGGSRLQSSQPSLQVSGHANLYWGWTSAFYGILGVNFIPDQTCLMWLLIFANS